jgi:hypothetical protein
LKNYQDILDNAAVPAFNFRSPSRTRARLASQPS